MKPVKNDFLLAVRKASFTLVPESLPLGGMIGEERFRGLRSGSQDKQILDSTMIRTRVKGNLTGSLDADATVVEFRDFPVVRLSVTLKNGGAEDLCLSRLALFRHEFCGDEPKLLDAEGNEFALPAPPHRPKEGEEAPALPPMPKTGVCFLVYDEFTVLIDSSLPKRFHSEPAGASAILALHGETVPANGEKEYPDVTLLICEGDSSRAKELYTAFLAAHSCAEE